MKFFLAAMLLSFTLAAHVGVSDVFFEGLAGPYPLYVTIRPPMVIPGVAEISIRSAAKDVKGIRITPMALTGAGAKYPPTPDQAVRSKEDPQLFTGGLWIMRGGAWQVRAMVEGDRGAGVVSVPVPAMSQRVTTMDSVTGWVLALLMVLLAAGVVGIAGAAMRESQLAPGVFPDVKRVRSGRIAMVVGLMVAGVVIWFGRGWWEDESQSYAKSIYKPLELKASLAGAKLSLQIESSQKRELDDFVLDHGHLMHLYAVREPKLDAVYHLHPRRDGAGKFSLGLPAMPAGEYRLFADVVHKSGFPETLTAKVSLPRELPGPAASTDDAGAVFVGPIEGVVFERPEKVVANQAVTLRFRVQDKDGNPAANLREYLGMAAHMAIVKKDFSVFSHIHPSGNISMAAYEMAQSNLLPLSSNVLVSSHAKEAGSAAVPAEFGFPFGFPSPGEYRLILQFARQERVETASFDITIQN